MGEMLHNDTTANHRRSIALLRNSTQLQRHAAIVLVDWAVVPEEYANAGYIATIHLSTRTHIYIGPDDALHLQDALENYNQASGRGDIKRNRTTFQEPTSKQNNQKVAVAASGSNGGTTRR
jgi:hypothetical protein